jgi:hypothetical protein
MTKFKYPHTFTFCAPSTTKSVYAYGSWDGYACGYALTICNNTSTWNGTIKFPITTTVKPDGTFIQIYWYHVCYSLTLLSHFLKFNHSTRSTVSKVMTRTNHVHRNLWPAASWTSLLYLVTSGGANYLRPLRPKAAHYPFRKSNHQSQSQSDPGSWKAKLVP